MNSLIHEANELLLKGDFEYAFCGGFAVELFLDKEVRRHGDIDIAVYWRDRDKIIRYMQSLGWHVYEMCGNGIAHHITDINRQIKAKRNIFCFKEDCELVKLKPYGEKDMYYLEFDSKGQSSFNFIEYLFNDRTETEFLYARNHDIGLELTEAILFRAGIPFLSPELILLYKSTDIAREGYQLDFDSAIPPMSSRRKSWLKNALNIMYPQGHPWIRDIQ